MNTLKKMTVGVFLGVLALASSAPARTAEVFGVTLPESMETVTVVASRLPAEEVVVTATRLPIETVVVVASRLLWVGLWPHSRLALQIVLAIDLVL